MSKSVLPEEARERAFRVSRRVMLQLTVAGSVAAISAQTLVQQAHAYDLALQEGLVVFSPFQAEVIQSMGARIWPGSEDDPGAREAGTTYYIDRAIHSVYSEHRSTYLRGIRELNAAARELHGDDFAYLDEDIQDEMMTRLSKGELEGVRNGKEFFALIRTHTLEGLFADPIYGGNRDFVGWKSVGYPGPYYFITEEEQQSFGALNMPVQSIVDL